MSIDGNGGPQFKRDLSTSAVSASRPVDGGAAVLATNNSERKLLIGGGASVALSLVSIVLGLSGVLPSVLATGLVVAALGIGLRVYVNYVGKAADPARRTRVSLIISNVGLAISLLTIVVSMPRFTRAGGAQLFFNDTFAHMWTVLLLLVACAGVRTLGWRVLVGVGVAGFLAVPGITLAIDRPLLAHAGAHTVLGEAVIAPFTEETIKALPGLLIVVLAARRRESRPSAVELALIGAITGGFFAIYENALYGRGGWEWSVNPILSWIVPTTSNWRTIGFTYAEGGHIVWTALVVFGLGIGIFYRDRYRRAWLAIPITYAVALTEHFTINAASATYPKGTPVYLDLTRVLTLDGWLSSLLLIAGVMWFGRIERRAVLRETKVSLATLLGSGFWLTGTSAADTSLQLAKAQRHIDPTLVHDPRVMPGRATVVRPPSTAPPHDHEHPTGYWPAQQYGPAPQGSDRASATGATEGSETPR